MAVVQLRIDGIEDIKRRSSQDIEPELADQAIIAYRLGGVVAHEGRPEFQLMLVSDITTQSSGCSMQVH